MSDSSILSGYFRIFTHALQTDKSVPFNTYVHLKAQKRVMAYVARDQVMTQERSDKLKALGFYNVYIKEADKSRYFHYLNDYLKTDEGKTALREYLMENADLTEVPGMPDEGEFELTALEDCRAGLGPTAVKDIEDTEFGSLKVSEDSEDEVVKYLKNKVNSLNDDIKLSGVFEDEEKITIQGVTQKIHDEIQRLKAIKKCSTKEQADQIIADVTYSIEDELILIRSLPLEKQEHLNELVQNTEAHLDYIRSLRSESDYPNVEQSKLEKITEPIESVLDKTKLLSASDTTSFVTDRMSSMAEEMNSLFGIKIKTDFTTQETNTPTGHLNDKEFETLKLLVIQLGKIVFQLKKQNSSIKRDFKDLRDNWFIFIVQAKKHLEVREALAVKDLEKEIKSFERNYYNSLQTSSTLWPPSQKICQILRIDNKELQQLKVVDDEVPIPEDLPDDVKEVLSTKEEDFEKDEDSNEDSRREVQQLRSELDILRLQLENSEDLVNSSTQKAEELEALYKKKDAYISDLEEDLASFRKRVETQTQQLLEKGDTEERVEKMLEMADTKAYHSSADAKQAQKRLEEAELKLETLEQELKLYREKVQKIAGKNFDPRQLDKTLEVVSAEDLQLSKEHAALLSAKDKVIDLQARDLEKLRESSLRDRKDVISIRAEFSNMENEKSRLKKQIETLKRDFEVTKKNSRNIEIKLDSNSNLLKHSQATVNKMTNLVENLKADRQKYIRETNVALNNFKDMVNKAMSLDRQVDAMDRQLHSAEKTKTNLKSENKELKANYAKNKNRADALEKENRSLQLKISRMEELLKRNMKKAG